MTTPAPRTTYWFHRHPAPALGAIVVGGIVLSLAAAEMAARALMPQWAPVTAERVVFWRYDPALGWSHRPGQSGRFVHPDFDVEVRINARGLRDDDTPLERSRAHRMLVLGDSFGWGFGVERRQRFSELIERARPDWDVVNASVSGYGTDQELLYLRREGFAYRPDVVLVLFHENDLENNSRSEAYWYEKPYFTLEADSLVLHNVPVPESSLKERCNRFFYGRTYLLGRIYALLGRLTHEARRPFWSQAQVTAGDGEGRAVTRALIHEIDRACRASGARAVVVSVPSPDEPVRWLEGVCSERGIPYLSLDAAFDAAGADLTFPHDGHWTREGHAVAARAIAAFLDASGVAGAPSTN